MSNHNIFAPIIIPTLCRDKHFKRCVKTLAMCSNASNTELYIALDYPKNENHWLGYSEIKNYINQISAFKAVKIIERKENFGAERNIYDAISYVMEKHDRFILSEDDNEFSPNFLDYINYSLGKYSKNENVIAVTGYNRMIDTSGYNRNVYAALSYSAWGTGFLGDNFKFLTENVIQADYAKSILKSWAKSCKIYKRYPSLLHGLLSIVKTGHVTGDTLVVSYMVLNNKYCIWPTLSKVRNHGFDGGGEHFGSVPDHPLLTQKIDTATSFEPDDIPIEENALMRERNEKYGRQSSAKEFLFGIYIPLRYLIYRLTGKIIYK